jgi:hypothetical protein
VDASGQDLVLAQLRGGIVGGICDECADEAEAERRARRG